MKRAMLVAVVVGAVALSVNWGLPAAEGDVTIGIAVAPGTLVIPSHGVWVTVHADIPHFLVNGTSVTLNGVPAAYTFADDRGNLVAKFRIAEIKAIVEPPSATLVLRGLTKTGVAFSGIDTIRVVGGSKR